MNGVNEHLASRARVEIFVQAVRVIKALLRSRRNDDAKSLMDAMREGTTHSWETDIEGIRGKRLFKKSIAIMRSLLGEHQISDVLPKADVDFLDDLINYRCLVVEKVTNDTRIEHQKKAYLG